VCVWLQALSDTQREKDAAALKVAEDELLAHGAQVRCPAGPLPAGVASFVTPSIRSTALVLPTDSGPLTGMLALDQLRHHTCTTSGRCHLPSSQLNRNRKPFTNAGLSSVNHEATLRCGRGSCTDTN
jgi:hypothetical protein